MPTQHVDTAWSSPPPLCPSQTQALSTRNFQFPFVDPTTTWRRPLCGPDAMSLLGLDRRADDPFIPFPVTPQVPPSIPRKPSAARPILPAQGCLMPGAHTGQSPRLTGSDCARAYGRHVTKTSRLELTGRQLQVCLGGREGRQAGQEVGGHGPRHPRTWASALDHRGTRTAPSSHSCCWTRGKSGPRSPAWL